MVAVAFTGTPNEVIGIHAECMDSIDNDADGDIDAWDDQCWEYPFADGGAEYGTTPYPNGKMWSSDSYEMTLHEWRFSQNELDPALFGIHNYCFGNYDQEYADLTQITQGEDNSEEQYAEWFAQNCN